MHLHRAFDPQSAVWQVWMQTLAKGKATPIHSHAHCEVSHVHRFPVARLHFLECNVSRNLSLSSVWEVRTTCMYATLNMMRDTAPYKSASCCAGGEHCPFWHR